MHKLLLTNIKLLLINNKLSLTNNKLLLTNIIENHRIVLNS